MAGHFSGSASPSLPVLGFILLDPILRTFNFCEIFDILEMDASKKSEAPHTQMVKILKQNMWGWHDLKS